MRVRAISFVALILAACGGRFGPVYPSRPAPTEAPAAADPPPSRVVTHLAVTSAAIRAALEDAVPTVGEGVAPVLGGRKFRWARKAFDVTFGQGRIALATSVQAVLSTTPLTSMDLPLDLRVEAEPIVSSEYAVKLQSVAVHVTSRDARLAIADRVAGLYDKIGDPIAEKLKAFTYDLRPLLLEAQSRIAKPIDVPVGDAHGCAMLKVLGIEAAPTVLADGLEKDVAILVAPSITLPCDLAPVEPAASLPPFANVASMPTGPFTITIPIAARYDELTRAMTAAFTDGKLFFSTEYPQLFLEKPEIYESQGGLVLKLHLQGPVKKLGIEADLDGDLYLSGHPAVVDNELRIPDLEPTIETKNFLLSIKAMTDSDRIRDQARAALRLDIGERLRPVREKLSSDLTFGSTSACFHGDVDRVEVTGVYPHAAFLRVYVNVTARARATMPCAPGSIAPEVAPTPSPAPAASN
jgi:hypothetical protein